MNKLKSDFEPSHMLGVMVQKTNGEIHLVRMTANQQAKVFDFVFDLCAKPQLDEEKRVIGPDELETIGTVSQESLEWYYDGKFVLTGEED